MCSSPLCEVGEGWGLGGGIGCDCDGQASACCLVVLLWIVVSLSTVAIASCALPCGGGWRFLHVTSKARVRASGCAKVSRLLSLVSLAGNSSVNHVVLCLKVCALFGWFLWGGAC